MWLLLGLERSEDGERRSSVENSEPDPEYDGTVSSLSASGTKGRYEHILASPCGLGRISLEQSDQAKTNGDKAPSDDLRGALVAMHRERK